MSFPKSTFVVGALCFAAGAGVMWAQRQQGTSYREPQFENENVQVWKSVVLPNQPLSMHRHDHGRALIALTDGRLEIVDKSGKRLNMYDLKAGKAMWLGVDPPGQQHADVNPGTKPLEVIVVQLKNDIK